MYCKYDSAHILKLFADWAGYQDVEQSQDFLIDYFGARIPLRFAQYLSQKNGTKITTAPFPDDGIRASFIEYLAVVESVQDCSDIYQMAEIGASYAPFSVVCAKLALRKGLKKIVLRPVEASLRGHESIRENFMENDLITDAVDFQILHAAVIGHYKEVYFPDVDCTIDNGGAPQNEHSETDIRGVRLPLVKVPGVPLSFVVEKFSSNQPIDLLHIDIQGSEYYAIPMDIQLLTSSVKRVLLATHSRPIEGKMMEIFHAAGWRLIAEEPCGFTYREDLDSIEGMTTKDGSQYWVNARL